jgi:hypothetical protein
VVTSLPLVYLRCFSKTLNYLIMAKTMVCNNKTLRGMNLDINVVVSLDSPSSEL